jgi:hypothetical protein
MIVIMVLLRFSGSCGEGPGSQREEDVMQRSPHMGMVARSDSITRGRNGLLRDDDCVRV